MDSAGGVSGCTGSAGDAMVGYQENRSDVPVCRAVVGVRPKSFLVWLMDESR